MPIAGLAELWVILSALEDQSTPPPLLNVRMQVLTCMIMLSCFSPCARVRGISVCRHHGQKPYVCTFLQNVFSPTGNSSELKVEDLPLSPSPSLPPPLLFLGFGLSCTQTNYPLAHRVCVTCTWSRLTPALCMSTKRVLLLHDVANMQVTRVFF